LAPGIGRRADAALAGGDFEGHPRDEAIFGGGAMRDQPALWGGVVTLIGVIGALVYVAGQPDYRAVAAPAPDRPGPAPTRRSSSEPAGPYVPAATIERAPSADWEPVPIPRASDPAVIAQESATARLKKCCAFLQTAGARAGKSRSALQKASGGCNKM